MTSIALWGWYNFPPSGLQGIFPAHWLLDIIILSALIAIAYCCCTATNSTTTHFSLIVGFPLCLIRTTINGQVFKFNLFLGGFVSWVSFVCSVSDFEHAGTVLGLGFLKGLWAQDKLLDGSASALSTLRESASLGKTSSDAEVRRFPWGESFPSAFLLRNLVRFDW